MSFQKLVLIIATVLLIVVLIMFGIAFSNNKTQEQYPPVLAECPDYWEVKKGKDGLPLCNNVKEVGNSNCQREMNFIRMPFIGKNGRCNKKKWATACGVTWDGVTNAYGVCE